MLSALLVPLALAVTPELQAQLDAAEAAWTRKEEAEAERQLTLINEADPSWDKPWRRRCGVVMSLGRTSEAIDLCRKALAIDPNVENRTALALAIIRDTAGLEVAAEEPLREARALIEAAVAARPDYPQAWAALCELAITGEDPEALARCVGELEKHQPDEAGTLYYRVHLDLGNADYVHARKALIAARSKGLSDDLYQPMVVQISLATPEDQPTASTPAGKGLDIVGLLPWVIGGGLILSVAAIVAMGERGRQAPPPT